MSEDNLIFGQLVMIRDDGSSILDKDATVGQTSDARKEEIARRLKDLGIEVVTGDGNTLSISATPEILAELFGIEAGGAPGGSRKIPDELSAYVADVFISPAPEMFP